MAHTPNYNSPSELKTFLEENEMGMQKKFGQNFLINQDARIKLASATDIKKNTKIWEVGPGLGALTSELLTSGAIVTAFEIDRGFSQALTNIFDAEIEKNQFSIITGDFLKTWKLEFQKHGIPDRFFGNLPYNVGAKIIGDLIDNNIRFEKSVVTVQKEVALRMEAKPGTKDYSSFSILCQWAYDITPLIDLKGSSFWPRPNVDSRAVVMNKRENYPACTHPKHFMNLQRALFISRRKTIKNNLGKFYQNQELADQVLRAAGIENSVRAETLDIPTLLHLADISADIQKLPTQN